jgi:hypothetical protein
MVPGSSLCSKQPIGKTLADIHAARRHAANQIEMVARNFGASILGSNPGDDMTL